MNAQKILWKIFHSRVNSGNWWLATTYFECAVSPLFCNCIHTARFSLVEILPPFRTKEIPPSPFGEVLSTVDVQNTSRRKI